jgi:hypothetical protein
VGFDTLKCFAEVHENRNVEDAIRIKVQVLDVVVLTVYFGTPSMFITLWFRFDYGTNPPLGTLII